MRRVLVSLFLLITLVALPLVQVEAKEKNAPPSRELQGLVKNKADAPLADAIVYLKNAKTMAVKTYITGKDGSFRFPALGLNVDYTLYAERNGKRSETKTLSQFDSRSKAIITLRIDSE